MVDFYLICLTNCDNVNQYQNCALILWPTKLKSRKNVVLILVILPYEDRVEFCQIFYSFLGNAMEFQEKMLLRFTDF